MAKKMIIKGVGKFLVTQYNPNSLTNTGPQVLTLGTMQDLKVEFDVTIDKIYGGDGLFNIDTLVKEKAITVTATDAKLDLAQISLMMGSQLQENTNNTLWALQESQILSSGSSYTLDNTLDSNLSITYAGTNTILSSGTDYTVNGSTVTLVNPILGGVYYNSYQYAASGIDIITFLANEVPFPVQIVHHGSFLQKDGTYRGIETCFYQALAQGKFTVDAKRATAETSQVSLDVLDPERPDGQIGYVKMYNGNASSGYSSVEAGT